ncbi:hypothetical protein VTH06DRAFT_6822 [Thermothelomyces fergusii]
MPTHNNNRDHRDRDRDRDGSSSSSSIPTSPPAGFSFDDAEMIYQHGDRVVWKVGRRYVLKRTALVDAGSEAATHRFVWKHTTVPLPRLYGEWVSPSPSPSPSSSSHHHHHRDDHHDHDRRHRRRRRYSSYYHYLLQERVPGQTLKECWGRLSRADVALIAEQVAGYMAELARIRGRRMQTLTGARLPTNCFIPRAPPEEEDDDDDDDDEEGGESEAGEQARLGGRWATDEEVFEGAFGPALRRRGVGEAVVRACRRTMPRCEGQLALTHGDLYVGNVVVDPDRARVTGLIDWETAGFWPEWFQYARITHGCSRDDREWKRALSRASRPRIRQADHGRVWLDAVRLLLHRPDSLRARSWLSLLLRYQRGEVGCDALRNYRNIDPRDITPANTLPCVSSS